MPDLLFALLQIALASHSASSHTHPAPPSAAIANDNRVAAGRIVKGVLTLNLEARDALWYPEEGASQPIPIAAFAEAGAAPRAPGPMIRVPAGTEMRITVHNALAVPMRLWGLQDRSGSGLDSTVIAPGATQTFEFRADIPGTFFYWGRTGVRPPLPVPGAMTDALLTGAFIVDPAGATVPKDERVLMISLFSDTISGLRFKSEAADREMQRELIPRERWFLGAINGRSW